MIPLRTIVVDDENLARRGLAMRLAEIPQLQLIAECANGYEALQCIRETTPTRLPRYTDARPGMALTSSGRAAGGRDATDYLRHRL